MALLSPPAGTLSLCRRPPASDSRGPSSRAFRLTAPRRGRSAGPHSHLRRAATIAAPLLVSAAAAAGGASYIRRSGVRELGSLPETFRETFAVDLLGLGRMTEQRIEAPKSSELLPFRLRRPLGIVFEERAAAEGSSAPAGALQTVVAERDAGGAAQVR